MLIQTVDLRQLMLNPYVVIRAAPLLRHAVDMFSLCLNQDLYGLNARSKSVEALKTKPRLRKMWLK